MKLCTCFCHGLEMCTSFGYNPWFFFFFFFCYFFYFVNFVIFWPQILWKCIDRGYLVSAAPYTISCLSLCNFAHLFFHGLKMCVWFGFNPAVNFYHFSTLLTLSFFAGATSASPKFDLYLLYKQYILLINAWHDECLQKNICCHVLNKKEWKKKNTKKRFHCILSIGPSLGLRRKL